MYETIRIVEKLKPKYVIWENVKNLLSKKHRHNFDNYLDKMSELGYKNYYQVLNAKDYGIPQNRERVFTISIRNDIEKEFIFPNKQELKLKLKDMLEQQVDEKYYLSDKMCKYITSEDDKYKVNKNLLVFNRDIACSKTTREGNTRADTSDYIRVKNATKQGYDTATNGDSINLVYPQSQTRRGRVGHEVSQTLQCNDSMGTMQDSRIRKLTPKECWRLMGFNDKEFEKAEKVNSNTQLYKQAGNSIVVNVLEEIIKELLEND